MKSYYVYIMSNQSRILYTGVTNDLERRVAEHKSRKGDGFTAKYNCTWLVFYDSFSDVNDAIRAEKKIKGWTKAKKVALIESKNPEFEDLSASWRPQPDSSRSTAQNDNFADRS